MSLEHIRNGFAGDRDNVRMNRGHIPIAPIRVRMIREENALSQLMCGGSQREAFWRVLASYEYGLRMPIQ
ncbi:hypothetical protein [Thioalkalivibrio sp. XN8]|uniref:hypothetical protein n=1 Tax=Thioalkalivibrio sp. XN8 TaxID=2712863 RepID=UPI0013EDB2DF|nr:hypothetical protein [Thioalkalivibrio sp. XN8]NGP52161.1 hypothetical protein [Thioalkalivibrio sp. XN8]